MRQSRNIVSLLPPVYTVRTDAKFDLNECHKTRKIIGQLDGKLVTRYQTFIGCGLLFAPVDLLTHPRQGHAPQHDTKSPITCNVP